MNTVHHLLCRTGVRAIFCLLLAWPFAAAALVGEPSRVSERPAPGSLPLFQDGRAAAVWVAASDDPAVHHAARAFQHDVERVTGVLPSLHRTAEIPRGPALVVAGSVTDSPLIRQLVDAGKLDVRDIEGRWEAFLHQVVEQPWPGVERALVIAGSDRRGTVYGIYELSEQIGVSPWYWWADVPVARRTALHVAPERAVDPGPVVQYRGIFLNDEAPALTGWVHEKFGAFNAEFYTHVFELILRLRGNYLWPAMWLPRAFNDDDPRNPQLAHEYGIVMGTSHHEPMMRAHDEWNRYGEGPWNYEKNAERLQEFWRGGFERVEPYDKIVSLGMRGDGDEPMSEEANVALLERIVADQREIIAEVTGQPPEQTPQLWALYKEVQGYYERGMRVPDDVILLWCDDNWGNIRRLPTPAEQERPGGAGVYYHFDYVGGPRNYKWLNTVPITKIWEQMHLAWRYDANRIWIVNVGDLKPMEFPIEFFLTYAWDPARIDYDDLEEYSRAWAAREFGADHATEVAALINGYTKLNGRRKPEMLAPDTYSLVNYREAEQVRAEWTGLVERAERLQDRLPPAAHDAYFQLVLYPVKASAVVHELHRQVGLNRLYTRQGRVDANAAAERARALFAEDAALVDAYHSLGGGRWNHMMAQIKLGYTYWQQPDIEAMPAVHEVRPRAGAALAVAIEGSETAWPSYGAGTARLPALDARSQGTRWIELFRRGEDTFTYEAKADQPWVTLSPASGRVDSTVRLEVGADWSRVPRGESLATITIDTPHGETARVQVPVHHRPNPEEAEGRFVETDGAIAIEAPHFARAVDAGDIHWKRLPDFGRTLGGVTPFPVTAPDQEPGGDSPRLEYDLFTYSAGEAGLELHFAPSLDFQPGPGLRFAISLDDGEPQVVELDTWETLQTWEKAVADGVRRVNVPVTFDQPGAHVLKVWMVTPGVVLQRVIVDFGGVRSSNLGPPESPRSR